MTNAGHRQTECPKKAVDVYRLPDAVQQKVEEQYARVSRAAGAAGQQQLAAAAAVARQQ
jgi:hypothetical protein